ncbi:MAG: hypothetical protein LIO96_02810, partial [Lachnospiraceae bacterium]|nr:hypothetical protein [Lachnospiraceae bacterium]
DFVHLFSFSDIITHVNPQYIIIFCYPHSKKYLLLEKDSRFICCPFSFYPNSGTAAKQVVL